MIDEMKMISESDTELEKIKEDFKAIQSELNALGKMHLESLSQINNVHALNYRIKNSDSLINKIKRKRATGKRITLKNYKEEITDLLGVRILHKFKDDWYDIDEHIRSTYELIEDPPIAYIRKGDNTDNLSDKFEIKEHDFGYRSLHYIVKSMPKKTSFKFEIQVRTIFEEAWGEIDHAVRYPDLSDDKFIEDYSLILNRLSGLGDEMAINMRDLKIQIEKDKSEIAKQIKNLQLNESQKQELQKAITTKDILLTTIGIKLFFDLFKDKNS